MAGRITKPLEFDPGKMKRVDHPDVFGGLIATMWLKVTTFIIIMSHLSLRQRILT